MCRIRKNSDECADGYDTMNIIRTFWTNSAKWKLNKYSLCSVNNWYKYMVGLVSSSVGALAHTSAQDEVSGELSLSQHSDIASKLLT